MRVVMLLAVLALPLAACKATVQDGSHKITVEKDGDRHSDFCPPGQGKKGNC